MLYKVALPFFKGGVAVGRGGWVCFVKPRECCFGQTHRSAPTVIDEHSQDSPKAMFCR